MDDDEDVVVELEDMGSDEIAVHVARANDELEVHLHLGLRTQGRSAELPVLMALRILQSNMASKSLSSSSLSSLSESSSLVTWRSESESRLRSTSAALSVSLFWPRSWRWVSDSTSGKGPKIDPLRCL